MADRPRLHSPTGWLIAALGLSLVAAPALSAKPRGSRSDPYEAYREGRYEEALEGFVDHQVERPGDPEASINVGSSRYKVGDLVGADQAFERAAAADDAAIRQRALYNLGNSAFRQGRLEAAAERYRAALEIEPKDEDAKFNLELTLREIERRRQQARQQQKQPSEPQEDGGGQQDDAGAEGTTDPSAEPPPKSDPESGPEPPPEPAAKTTQPPDSSPSPSTSPLPGQPAGQTESEAAGEAEGEGEGESDQDPATSAVSAEPLAGMTEAEAERLLAALDEGRPDLERTLPKGLRRRVEKDW